MIDIRNPVIESSTERMSFSNFLRNYQLFRLSELTSKLKKVPDDAQLPINSVLHLLDNFKKVTLNEPISDIPDLNNIFINNEPAKPHIYHQTTHTQGPVQVPKDYIFRTANLDKNLQKFRFQNGSKFLYESNVTNLSKGGNYLGVINHNPMFRTFCRGALAYWRSFNAIFAAILNITSIIDDKHHYFYIPLIPKIYPKTAFIRTFDKITFGSLTDKTSYQYCFFVHLYNYINSDSKVKSIFDEVPEHVQQLITFIFECEGLYLLVNLRDLKNFNENGSTLNRIINKFNAYLLEALAIKENKESEIVEIEETEKDDKEVEEEVVNSYNKISKDHKVLAEDEMADNDEQTAQDDKDDEELQKVLSEITGLTNVLNKKAHGLVDGIKIKDEDIVQSEVITNEESFDEEEINKQEDHSLPKNARIPDGIMHSATTDKELSNITDNIIDSLEARAYANIANDDSLSPARKERARKLLQKYKAVTLEGETLLEILNKKVDPKIDDIDCSNIEHLLVDKSMAKSSICGMDSTYINSGMYKRDLVLTALSLIPQGMYLIDIKKDVTVNQLDQSETYIFKYQTVTGKNHSVKFTLPIIKEDGTCMIGGVLMSFKKQMVNKPICKVTPTRVSLSSNFNKTIVERRTSVAHNFPVYLNQLLKEVNNKEPGLIRVEEGINHYPETDKLPMEYVDVALKYNFISVKHKGSNLVSTFKFHPDSLKNYRDKESAKLYNFSKEYEKKNKCIYLGEQSNKQVIYFMNLDSSISIVNISTNPPTVNKSSLVDIISNITKVRLPKVLTEWVDVKLLDKKFPVIFVLGFRYGLTNIMKYLNIPYIVVNRRSKKVVGSYNNQITEYNRKQTDVIIKFNEVNLIVPRYPILKSLLIAGLASFDLMGYMLEEFDHKDVYYNLLGNKHNYLRGIDNLFDLFIDPKTFEILQQMHEPTNFRDLLIRATQMLSTSNYHESSSVYNHRIRSFDRLPAIVYNEMARTYADFRRKSGSEGATFSINPSAVLLRVISDPAMQGVENQNALHDVKSKSAITFLGVGGRTGESFTHKDRRYPKDGIGVISEATVDSGKVAINAQASMNPVLINQDGFSKEVTDIFELGPANVLSANGLLMPAATQDDGKRLNLSGIIGSHSLPTKDGEVARVRTGYEKIMPILADNMFAYTAKEDGVVTDINEEIKMVTIKYKSGKTYTFTYDDIYGTSSDLVTTQKQVLAVKKGQRFKKNDVLRYNPEMFEIDFENPSCVCMKHGITATVALVDTSTTFEDSNVISKEFGKRLTIQPVAARTLDIPIDSVIQEFKFVGSEVLSSDPLLVFEDADTADLTSMNIDEASLAYLEKLNRTAPKAKFTGKIVKINCYYHKSLAEMHPTVASVVRKVVKEDNLRANYSKDTKSNIEFIPSSVLPKDSKYKGINLSEDNVIFQFFIQENIESGIGDKIILDTALKTVTSTVMEVPLKGANTGRNIDVMYAAIGVSNRIVTSPFICGVAETVLEKTEEDIINMYFN